MQSIPTRVRSAIGQYPPLLWLLGIGSFVNVMGLSFIWPISTIYMHEHLGQPLTVVGVVLLFHYGGAALGSLTGGTLFDRIGARRVIVVGSVVAAAAIALPGFVESWPLYVAVMIVFGFASNLAGPAINALAAKAWPQGGRKAYNFLYVAHNAGVAVGTALGGALAQRSFRTAFLGAAAMALLFAVWVAVAIRDDAVGAQAGEPALAGDGVAGGPQGPSAIPWPPVLAIFGGCLLLWALYMQWLGAVPVTMQAHGLSLATYSRLWTLNGLLIVLGQPVFGWATRRVRSLFSQLALGTLFFAVSYGVLTLSHRFEAFLAAMVLLTIGEMLAWPALPAATAQLAPPDRRGFLQGLVGSAATAGRMVGPLMGGLIYDHLGFGPLMVFAAVAHVVPLACFVVYRRTGR